VEIERLSRKDCVENNCAQSKIILFLTKLALWVDKVDALLSRVKIKIWLLVCIKQAPRIKSRSRFTMWEGMWTSTWFWGWKYGVKNAVLKSLKWLTLHRWCKWTFILINSRSWSKCTKTSRERWHEWRRYSIIIFNQNNYKCKSCKKESKKLVDLDNSMPIL